MNTWINRLVFVFTAAFLLSHVSIASSALRNVGDESWRFKVWLDDTPIGYHQVSVNRESNRKTVLTQASFDVRVLFIPVYSYEHETREQWENGCVVNITSRTDDNGDSYFISTTQQPAPLELETQDGVRSIDGCVRTFAYWDVGLLQSERLLNTQTGEYLPVSVADMGTASLSVDDGEVEARRFRLVADGMTIDLWYTTDMRWLALESITESGAVLRYLPDSAAALTPGAQL